MKKIYTLLLSLSTFLAVQAQSSYQVIDEDNGNADVSGTTYNIWTSAGTLTEKEFAVKNTSSSNKVTRCKRRMVSGIQTADVNAFCWNSCFPASNVSVYTSGTVTINAGSMASYHTAGIGFHSSFTGASVVGDRVIRYTFYDNANNSDSTFIIIVYHITGVGYNEIANTLFQISAPSPSPATDESTISYNFSSPVQTASLQIFNASGALVKEFKLEELKGKIIINTSELAGGLYFCNLMVNSRAIETKKLVVAH